MPRNSSLRPKYDLEREDSIHLLLYLYTQKKHAPATMTARHIRPSIQQPGMRKKWRANHRQYGIP